MMEVDVRDPRGLTHKLQYDAGEWFGHENLAHGFPRPMRGQVTNQVLVALTAGWPLPHGFARIQE